MFIDTHCHVHESELFASTTGHEAAKRATENGVEKLVCVGTSIKSSKEAIGFAKLYDFCYATVGVHPHDTKDGVDEIKMFLDSDLEHINAIGEVGLDYYYNNSPKDIQINALEQQLQWAKDYDLPVSFHVREAFSDFWPIFDNFNGLKGVLHSYTDSIRNLEIALSKGLYVGVNGISTFAKDNQAMWDTIPLESMLLETDAPFLTPVPYRGKVNEPAFVRNVAEYHADRRAISVQELATKTSQNATHLFNFG